MNTLKKRKRIRIHNEIEEEYICYITTSNSPPCNIIPDFESLNLICEDCGCKLDFECKDRCNYCGGIFCEDCGLQDEKEETSCIHCLKKNGFKEFKWKW